MAADMFLKIDGVEGGSRDKEHPKEIEIEAWNVGASMTPLKGGGGKPHTGKVVHDITITMRADRSIPILLEACAKGRLFGTATITGRKAGGQQEEYLKVKMSEVLIVNIVVHAAKGLEAPMVDVALNFTKNDWEYKTQDSRGLTGMPVRVGYDIKTDRLA